MYNILKYLTILYFTVIAPAIILCVHDIEKATAIIILLSESIGLYISVSKLFKT